VAAPQLKKGYEPLSVHRAFLARLRVNSEVAEGRLTGRVEHVVSGQTAHFDSLEELLAFIVQILTQQGERRWWPLLV
jgi:hypothetical protein